MGIVFSGWSKRKRAEGADVRGKRDQVVDRVTYLQNLCQSVLAIIDLVSACLLVRSKGLGAQWTLIREYHKP
eukprot:1342772-Heterocapsa_arctica.AAC.1